MSEREEFMEWLRAVPGFALTAQEAVDRWEHAVQSGDAAKRYRRGLKRASDPDTPKREED